MQVFTSKNNLTMKQIFIIFILFSTLISCQKEDLTDAFDCKGTTNFSKTKEYTDVLKHFKINIPKSWNTELYYDEFQSELYSADTTKQLTETYIVDITWHQGELVFNDDFEQKVLQVLKNKEQLKVVKSGYGKFKKLSSYYNLSQGKNSNLDYHFLQIFIKYKADEYYTLTTKIYGNEFIEERICTSISLFNSITFIE